MPPKKISKDAGVTAAAVASLPEDYEYNENLSVRVKPKTEHDNPDLNHYFGPLLRCQKPIDKIHKYCSLCLELHIVKR